MLVFSDNMNDSNNFVVKFLRKPTKRGKYFYFSIPIQLIRSEIIDPAEEYEIKIYRKKP